MGVNKFRRQLLAVPATAQDHVVTLSQLDAVSDNFEITDEVVRTHDTQLTNINARFAAVDALPETGVTIDQLVAALKGV